MNQEYILEMGQIVKQFPVVLALDKVDFNVKPGEIMAVIGENGAGKSTLKDYFRCIYSRFRTSGA